MAKAVIKRTEEPQDWFENGNWHDRYLGKANQFTEWWQRVDWWLFKEQNRASAYYARLQASGQYNKEIRKDLSMRAVNDLHRSELKVRPYAVSSTTLGNWAKGNVKNLSNEAVALVSVVEGWTKDQAERFLDKGILPTEDVREVIEKDITDLMRNAPSEDLPDLFRQIAEAVQIGAFRLQSLSIDNSDLPPTVPTIDDSVPFVSSTTKDKNESMCTTGAYLSFLLSERGFNPRSDIAIRQFVSRSMANQIPADRMRLLVSDQATPAKSDWNAIAQTLNVIDGIEEDGDQEPWDRPSILKDFAAYQARTQSTIK